MAMQVRGWKVACTIPLALLTVGCGEFDTPPATLAGMTDSAGVVIVTSAPKDIVYAEIATEPTLSIGMLDGPEPMLFGQITAVARDERSNVIVGDSQSDEIRIFDPEGAHLRTLGGAGEGPGEFQTLSDAWPVGGGRIVATDLALNRITLFDSTGAVAGTAQVEGVAGTGPDITSIFSRGTGGPGTVLHEVLLVSASSFMAGGGSFDALVKDMVSEPRILYVRHGFDGTLVDTVAEGRGRPVVLTPAGGGAWSFGALPFAPNSAAAGSSGKIVVTGGTGYQLNLFNREGSLLMIARLDERPPARTEAHLRALSEQEAGGAELAKELLEQYRKMPLPDTLPAYDVVRIADTGELWAKRFQMPSDETVRWDVFANDGVYRGRVIVPGSFLVHEISRGQLVGVVRGYLDVHRVEIRDIHPVTRRQSRTTELDTGGSEYHVGPAIPVSPKLKKGA